MAHNLKLELDIMRDVVSDILYNDGAYRLVQNGSANATLVDIISYYRLAKPLFKPEVTNSIKRASNLLREAIQQDPFTTLAC